MSNENSTTNLPRKKKSVSTLRRNKSGRVRTFYCRTYLDEIQLNMLLTLHLNQIRVYAYALHDKDTYKEDVIDEESGEVLHQKGDLEVPHYHIILILYNNATISAVKRWFFGFKDEKDMQINTRVEFCEDKYNAFDYLTHNTRKAIADGKYLYSDDIIVSNDINHFKGHYSADLDSAQLIMLDMCRGVPYREMIFKYGRDFIINFEKYKTLATELCWHSNFNPNDLMPDNTKVVYEYDNTPKNENNENNFNQEYVDF